MDRRQVWRSVAALMQVDAHSGEVVAEENETPDHEASEDANPKK